ncbi:hypothetical protein, partial [Methyloversatilis sp. XJ19-49]|uniref:hypothetical protein n=1 Tax=Methyloversatilis sp. XJ19-49 TaxID=2963429 RepID=UPI00211C5CB6
LQFSCHARFHHPRFPRNDIYTPLQPCRAHTYRLFVFLKSFAAEQREVRILRIIERPSIAFRKNPEYFLLRTHAAPMPHDRRIKISRSISELPAQH